MDKKGPADTHARDDVINKHGTLEVRQNFSRSHLKGRNAYYYFDVLERKKKKFEKTNVANNRPFFACQLEPFYPSLIIVYHFDV